MIPLEEARAHVLERCPGPRVERVHPDEARGRVLFEDIVTAEAVPPFANTAMDGFAVRAADTVGAPRVLRIVGTQAAGAAHGATVAAGEAVRIMTGALIPPGADAVVMVERTSTDGELVTVEIEVPAGNHVRAAGEDLEPGQTVFAAGTLLTPGHLGVLASIGCTEIAVARGLRVGVLSTGDELVDGDAPLAPGLIRDANRHALLALLAESGFDGVDLGIIADDETAIEEAFRSACHGDGACDAVLSSGGVSMGDFDYVKTVLDRLGDMRWMQVAIKPAKPLAFGTVGGVPVFGLPGNPVSSMVSFELFARPALLAMSGHAELDRRRLRAVAEGDLRRRPDGKTHFARVSLRVVDGVVLAGSAGGQGSHQLSAMAAADALAVLPDGDGVADGGPVEVLVLR